MHTEANASATREPAHRLKKLTLGDYIVYGALTLLCVLFLAPFVYVVSISLTDPDIYVPFRLYLIPERVSLKTYQYVLSNNLFLSSLQNTVFITLVGTVLNITATFTFAYALTKSDMPFRKLLMGLVVFTLMFNAGMIPNFLMIKNLGLMNSRWALILPSLTNAWSLLVAKSFLGSLPPELEESAKIDGCTDLGVFFRIVIPLSTASIATLTLFFAVGHWNTYFSALIYLTEVEKRTLQVYVKSLLIDNNTSGMGTADLMNIPSETVRMATVILAMLPILVVYPFLQKYFVKGVMLGSVKG